MRIMSSARHSLKAHIAAFANRLSLHLLERVGAGLTKKE